MGHTTQLNGLQATDPFAPPFFDFLPGCPTASMYRKYHLSPYLRPDPDL